MQRVAVSAVAALGALSLAAVSTATSSKTAREERVECKLAGIHFAGTTSQAQKVCLTFSKDGKALRQYAFGGRFKCSDGERRVGTTEIEPTSTVIEVEGAFLLGSGSGSGGILTKVAHDGTFSDFPGGSPSFFKGRLGGTKASGTLRQKFGGQRSGDVTCDTAAVRWTARRSAK